MKLKPLNDQILIKRVEADERTKGGLYIPETVREKPLRGEVIAVGPGKLVGADGERVRPPVEIGQHVLFKRYGDTEVRINDETFVFIRADDILGVFE